MTITEGRVPPGDISRLDYSDGTFDGVTCERAFQHLDAPETAIGEPVRASKETQQ